MRMHSPNFVRHYPSEIWYLSIFHLGWVDVVMLTSTLFNHVHVCFRNKNFCNCLICLLNLNPAQATSYNIVL